MCTHCLSTISIPPLSTMTTGSLPSSGSRGDVGEDLEESQGATLLPCSENPLADLLSDPPELQSVMSRSVDTTPVPMPSRTRGEGAESESGGKDTGGHAHTHMHTRTHTHTHTHTHTGVVEVFGSWNKVAPCLESRALEVEKQLQEAMSEQTVTVVAGHSRPTTGFSPPPRGGAY